MTIHTNHSNLNSSNSAHFVADTSLHSPVAAQAIYNRIPEIQPYYNLKTPAARIFSIDTAILLAQADLDSFAVAYAIRCVSDEHLYMLRTPSRQGFKSIYEYAKIMFAFSRRTTNTYLCAAKVFESIVVDTTLKIPQSISHVRCLNKFSDEKRREIWQVATSSHQEITEEYVMNVVAQYGMWLLFRGWICLLKRL